MRTLLTLLIIVVLLIGAAFLYAWSGMYNIAATHEHWDVTYKFIGMMTENSIKQQSDSVVNPLPATPEAAEAYIDHFHSMCRLCHSSPGYPRKEFAQGLYPSPPDLAERSHQQKWSDEDIFWIIEHGIKMSGMPAFSPTHSKEEIQGLAGLVRRMPELNESGYKDLLRKAGLSTEDQGHQDRGDGHGGAEMGETPQASEPGHSDGSTETGGLAPPMSASEEGDEDGGPHAEEEGH